MLLEKRRGSSSSEGSFAGGHDGRWQDDGRRGSTTRCTFQPDPPTVHFHDAPGNAQSESATAGGPATGFVHAVEAVEDPRQMLRGNPLAGVRYVDRDRGSIHADTDRDRPARWRVLDRVVDQVEKQMSQRRRICRYTNTRSRV